ncbi:MAG: hypothetical protein GXP14_14405 [Gammaproteobacteria bacterium]|nr:hypothetical protein [Gammaproteobacteria bacterium]
MHRATAPGPSAVTEGGPHFTRFATKTTIQAHEVVRCAHCDAATAARLMHALCVKGVAMKARKWLDRGLDRSDPIDLLTDSWRGFNNLFFQCYGGSEREKIKNFIAQSVSEETASQLITGHKHEIEYLLSRPVIDMSGNGRNTSRSIEAYTNANSSIEKLKEIFLIIYQVRCNLEHGQKSPDRERDVQLCASAWPFVAEVVDANA